MLMRDEDGRMKEASKVVQTTRQSNIHVAHPRQSLFLRKMSCLGCSINQIHTCAPFFF